MSTLRSAAFLVLALIPNSLTAQNKPWVYTKGFRNGTFKFVTSGRKVYEARCHRVTFIKGTAKNGDNVCRNTLASVNGCTPDRGYPETDTIALDDDAGDIVYHGTFSSEFMTLMEVRGATPKEFSQAEQVCLKMPWAQ